MEYRKISSTISFPFQTFSVSLILPIIRFEQEITINNKKKKKKKEHNDEHYDFASCLID